MANKQSTLHELAAEAGGEYIRRAGRGCLVRWPDGAGGQVTFETRQSLEEATLAVEVYEQIAARARS